MTPTPAAQPPPLPIKRPAMLAVIGFSVGAFLLFVLNLLLTFVIVALEHPHGGSISYLVGNVEGYFVVPLILIMCICVIWKSNRRPYKLLLCFFWSLLGLLILKVPTFFSLAASVQHAGQQ